MLLYKNQVLLAALLVAISLSAMGAYEFMGIPLTWRARAIVIFCFFTFSEFPALSFTSVGTKLFMLLLFFSLFVTLARWGVKTNSRPTTPYFFFIILRYFDFLAFLSAIGMTVYLARSGLERRLIQAWTNIATVV